MMLGPPKKANDQSASDCSIYDNLVVPMSELGPTPGNKPSPNPIEGAPMIRPPQDTVGFKSQFSDVAINEFSGLESSG